MPPNFLLIVFALILITVKSQYDLNGTGSVFASTIYTEAAFAHSVVEKGDFLTYHSESVGSGQCNIMGFWYSGNVEVNAPPAAVKTAEQALCTNLPATTAAQRQGRHPIVDLAATELLPSSSMYHYYPDLQLLPTVAGAIVPVYNIPELSSLYPKYPLILSRSSFALMYLGVIRYWNDSRILADNAASPIVAAALETISAPIKVIMRQDGASQTSVLATAISLAYPSSVAQIGLTSSPTWCDPLTDELQVMTVTGCTLAPGNVTMAFLSAARNIRQVSFVCDATAATLQALLLSEGHTTTIVSKTFTNPSNTSWSYQVGYSDPGTITKNWYQPVILSKPAGCTVSIKTKQEGGYVNNHVSGASALPITQSIFMQLAVVNSTSTQAVYVNITVTMGTSVLTTPLLPVTSGDMSAGIRTALNALSPSLPVTSVTRFYNPLQSPWVEYRVVMSRSNIISGITAYNMSLPSVNAQPSELTQDGVAWVYVMKLTDLNNFPLFPDSKYIEGYSRSGRYTCYKRGFQYKPWTYYTGYDVPGVLGVVKNSDYSLGYVALQFATTTPTASMINAAGNVVVASSDTVMHAVMELGGNFNSQLFASLLDGKSAFVWPYSTFSYFLVRLNDHLGSCERRKSAGKFILNFYEGATTASIASSLGFAQIPEYIRDIVVGKLKSSLRCADGSLVFPAAEISDLQMASEFSSVLQIYLNTFNGVNNSISWNITKFSDSNLAWSNFIATKTSTVGVFTLFSSRAEKLAAYANHPDVQTTTYANVAVTPIYHLNAFIAAGVKLIVSTEVLAGIFSGQIKYWNDTMLQEVNGVNKRLLPYSRIHVVVRSSPSDTTSLFLRYLAMNSETFRSVYDVNSSFVRGTVDFASVLDHAHLHPADRNTDVDYTVAYYEGSIGYFLHVSVPTSPVASFCRNNSCSEVILTTTGGGSLTECAEDASTAVTAGWYDTADFMTSTAAGCYPISGSVDYSTYVGTSDAMTNTHVRVQFSSWLYSGSNIAVPLEAQSITSVTTEERVSMFTDVCDSKTSALEASIDYSASVLGYTYCGYRDCTWGTGDFDQIVTPCDPTTSTQTAYYVANSDCLTNNPQLPIPSSVSFSCAYVPGASSLGQVVYAVASLAMLFCVAQGALTFYLTGLDTSFFKVISMVGGILMNGAAIVFVGENTNRTCLLRPWFFNISATLMFAPLFVKLHGVLLLTQKKKIARNRITNTSVALQVLAMLAVDIIILVMWTVLEKPAMVVKSAVYPSVLAPVEIEVCNTGLQSRFELAMLSYKASLLVLTVVMAVKTWQVDIARLTAVVSYNIAVVGGGIYFLTFSFGHASPGIAVLMRCLGIVICASFAVAVILLPTLVKLTKSALQDQEVFPEDGGSGFPSSPTGEFEMVAQSSAVFSPKQLNYEVAEFEIGATKLSSGASGEDVPVAVAAQH